MTWRRTPVVDEYAEDGRSVVMVGDQVILLAELATTALGEIGRHPQGCSVDHLARHLVERYGPPESNNSGTTAAHEIVITLKEHGLIELSEEELPRK